MESLLNIAKGGILALATIAVSFLLPEELIYPFYAMLLTFAAGVYVGFAFLDEVHIIEDRLEIFIALTFLVIAVSGLWFTPILLAAGWALHGFWDFLHHLRHIKTDTGKDYPLFCLIYDFIIAWYIFYYWVMNAP